MVSAFSFFYFQVTVGFSQYMDMGLLFPTASSATEAVLKGLTMQVS